MTNSSQRLIRAESVGSQVGPLLAGPARWRIARVYRHCFYCLGDNDEVICIGDTSIDRGPFTIICSGRAVTAAAALAGNRDIPSQNGAILLDDGIVIDTTGSKLWLADFNGCAGSWIVPDKALSILVETAADRAPLQSLGILVPALCDRAPGDDKESAATAALHQRLLQIINVVRREDAFDDPERLASLLNPLIGLGYGLTPSGDDFCAGCVLSLVAVGKPEQATVLATRLFETAQHRTTVISLAFYRALAASWLSESQARLLGCFATQQMSDLGDALRSVCRHGATSGWDMLAGFTFGIDLLLYDNHFPGLVASTGGCFSGGQGEACPAAGSLRRTA